MLTPAHFVQVSSELRAGFPNLRLHSHPSMIRIFLSFVITVVCFSMYRWLLIEAWFSQEEIGCPLAQRGYHARRVSSHGVLVLPSKHPFTLFSPRCLF